MLFIEKAQCTYPSSTNKDIVEAGCMAITIHCSSQKKHSISKRALIKNNYSFVCALGAQMSDSIDAILQLPQRKIVIAENDVFLDKQIKNDIFILMVEESA